MVALNSSTSLVLLLISNYCKPTPKLPCKLFNIKSAFLKVKMATKASKDKTKKTKKLEILNTVDANSDNNGDDTPWANTVSGADIMMAIQSLKQDFCTEISVVLTVMKDIQTNISECSSCVTQTEERISSSENKISMLKSTISDLKGKVKFLVTKTGDM